MRRGRGEAEGAASSYREKAKASFEGACDRCEEEISWNQVEVHHVDRDRSNDNDDNLERLCHECHRAEHHDGGPMWGLVCSMPRDVVYLLDEAVERHGFYSRSEAVARAVVDAYESSDESAFGGPVEAVSCWFSDDRHTKWVSDAVVGGGSEDGPNDQA